MKLELRNQMLSKADKPKILHDDRVCSGGSNRFELSGCLPEFIRENKGIKCDIDRTFRSWRYSITAGSSSNVKLCARSRALNFGSPK
jgi:hypothetical protein